MHIISKPSFHKSICISVHLPELRYFYTDFTWHTLIKKQRNWERKPRWSSDSEFFTWSPWKHKSHFVGVELLETIWDFTVWSFLMLCIYPGKSLLKNTRWSDRRPINIHTGTCIHINSLSALKCNGTKRDGVLCL